MKFSELYFTNHLRQGVAWLLAQGENEKMRLKLERAKLFAKHSVSPLWAVGKCCHRISRRYHVQCRTQWHTITNTCLWSMAYGHTKRIEKGNAAIGVKSFMFILYL